LTVDGIFNDEMASVQPAEHQADQLVQTLTLVIAQAPRIKSSTFSGDPLKKTRDRAKDGMGIHGIHGFMEVSYGKVSPSFPGCHPTILRCVA
jgi:hypothetical protein